MGTEEPTDAKETKTAEAVRNGSALGSITPKRRVSLVSKALLTLGVLFGLTILSWPLYGPSVIRSLLLDQLPPDITLVVDEIATDWQATRLGAVDISLAGGWRWTNGQIDIGHPLSLNMPGLSGMTVRLHGGTIEQVGSESPGSSSGRDTIWHDPISALRAMPVPSPSILPIARLRLDAINIQLIDGTAAQLAGDIVRDEGG
ncbi:MAG: hypothetical protein AAF556_12270, partial [Pseudomonadota bacterium]